MKGEPYKHMDAAGARLVAGGSATPKRVAHVRTPGPEGLYAPRRPANPGPPHALIFLLI